ncbi:MAG: heavy metal translocating P-type ATPase [Butyrivibrio sp.]|nr:heavy metal translocating P-type ATPase [Muribaculum sp.]MCM1552459.1 heavy metal translocating P-type ATPase [Butyrivibrio sp.]
MKERYHISGMTCSACSSHVEKAANKLAGVEKASVNLLTETMEIIYDEAQLSEGEIVRAVEKAGYGATKLIGGRHGAAGGMSVAQGTAGVGADVVEGGGEGMADGATFSAQRRDTGKEALLNQAREESRAMKWRLGISIGFLIPLMYVAMYHMIYELLGIPAPDFMLRTFHGNENAMIFALTQLLLVLPILYMNRKFFAVGFKTLSHLAPNMDSLIAVGASAALGYGIFAMYRIAFGLGHGDMALVEHYSHDLYFESAGTILTLITVGKYLESRSKGKTSEAITKLMDLSPKLAVRLREDGTEEEIPTESLRPGDVFLVKPGSLVPVDGTVLEGNSSIDEAAITGESVPVEKSAGDPVVSATMNKAGFLKCRAERVGDDTTLAQIIRLVEEASGSKAPIAQLADKVAGIFVPTVMGIALLTLIVWLAVGAETEFAISTAIAVLVISCPCALGLATPVAIMVGTGVGAGQGILIKSGEALQQARDVDTVVLDKTGTITEGKLVVMELSGYGGVTAETVLAAAAALERQSEHPLAEAILKEAEIRSCPVIPVRDFKAVFGRGIQGVVEQDIMVLPEWEAKLENRLSNSLSVAVSQAEACDMQGYKNDKITGDTDGPTATIGKKAKTDFVGIKAGTLLYVGNRAYLEENGIVLDQSAEDGLNRLADEGQTPLLVADGSRLLGMIGVADAIKESSRKAIRAWQKMGVHVVMLTGDNRRTAEAVRRRLELSEVVAEVLPQDKERKIRELKEAGHRVAMIGDGINDAPALASADVGMAIGAGTDVAIESADIILMKSDLRDAVTAMRLSRAVIRNIKQNLFWAFFYNSIGIPLAAGLLYIPFGLRLTPMFGAAAMSLSSIFVVGNALRLRGFKSGFQPDKQNADTAQTSQPQANQEQTSQAQVNQEQMNQPQAARGQINGVQANQIEQINQKEGGSNMTKVITVEGMMCAHCTGRVQKALEAVEGVSSVTMSLENKTATVELSAEVAEDVLKAAVTEAGYEVTAVA